MLKKGCIIMFVLILLATPTVASDFSISFEWGDIPSCTTGSPYLVQNPRFVLSNVPEGTKFIQFKMVDLDVPSYDHGGGTIEYTGNNVIEPGAFNYRSPCPPGGSHDYQWTAIAKKKTGWGGKLGRAKARKKYP